MTDLMIIRATVVVVITAAVALALVAGIILDASVYCVAFQHLPNGVSQLLSHRTLVVKDR